LKNKMVCQGDYTEEDLRLIKSVKEEIMKEVGD